MFGIGMQELAVILVVALLIFGPKRLPDLARNLGKGLAEFRRASNELRQSFMLESDDATRRPAGPVRPPAQDPRDERDPSDRPGQLVEPEAPAADHASGHGDLAEPEPDPAPAAEPAVDPKPQASARTADGGGSSRD